MVKETNTYLWVNVNEQFGRSVLPGVVKAVVEVLEAGNSVIVHCRAGKHRTGAFCTLVLVPWAAWE